ncbi:hypothetical protein J6590_050006 [Homalodisca vitripennis]|nr:hypothetical protein J6590_050006 [Homalodisca vitripennis]
MASSLMRKFKNIVSTLERIAECPVCLQTVTPPFKLCAAGHFICSGCIKTMKLCPICQKEFILENPICVKNMLEALPRFCRSAMNGCEVILNEDLDHELFCGFHTVKCVLDNCNDEVMVYKLLEHHQRKHPGDFVTDVNIFGTWKLEETSKTIPVYLFNAWFWVEFINIGNKYLKISFLLLPTARITDEYYVRVSFKRDHFYFMCTLRALVAWVLEDRTEESTSNEDSSGHQGNLLHYTILLPLKQLVSVLKGDLTLDYALEFFKETK